MSNAFLTKNQVAGADIIKYRILKHSAAETVIQAAAATDGLIGVCNEVAPLSGQRCDVILMGIADIEAGAAITVDAPITSDSVGRAVTAAPAAGTNNRVIGFALEAASAAGDVIRVLIAPHTMQG